MAQKAKKRKKRRRMTIQGIVLIFVMLLVTMLGIYGIIHLLIGSPDKKEPAEEVVLIETEPETEPPTEPPTEAPTEPPPLVEYPVDDGTAKAFGEELDADYAVLVDRDSHKILAQKNSNVRMYPASMTKLMTIIVAIEHTENFQDTFIMTQDILNDLWEQGASMVGFTAGEPCTVMDMLYGAALPSGADATTGLAVYVAGSERAFVRLMNQKVRELGLKDTHFMNASGLHDEKHYSTAEDMAVILDYCLQNELCRQVISTPTYVTTPTEEHPEGIYLADTMFKRMDGDEVDGITVKGGKTGFTDEAGHCLASYAETPDGRCYIAVTSMGTDRFQTVYDACTLYGFVTGTYPSEPETEAETIPQATLSPAAEITYDNSGELTDVPAA
ncbi:MAG: D-alanyl-D-alanine carboxypeptidase [Oscillospiraceae bacterium]|nr:D-alanyl-D-alanine carboxypeptidase [Oscillospiraceae bacterium]